jgi:hypothetical protein
MQLRWAAAERRLTMPTLAAGVRAPFRSFPAGKAILSLNHVQTVALS